MGANTELKAKLFDLLDEKKTLQNQQVTLLKANEEKEELIEEIRGQLHSLLNVAEKRAEMIRDLVRENRQLKEQLRTPAQPISKVEIADIQKDTLDFVISILQNEYQKIEGGFDF